MFQKGYSSNNSYKPVKNEQLKTSLGVLIAKGIIRKEICRELFIQMGLFQFISPKEQTLDLGIVSRILKEVQKWKSPNDAIYKMVPTWYITELEERCQLIANLFNQEEQLKVREHLRIRPRKFGLDSPTKKPYNNGQHEC